MIEGRLPFQGKRYKNLDQHATRKPLISARVSMEMYLDIIDLCRRRNISMHSFIVDLIDRELEWEAQQ